MNINNNTQTFIYFLTKNAVDEMNKPNTVEMYTIGRTKLNTIVESFIEKYNKNGVPLNSTLKERDIKEIENEYEHLSPQIKHIAEKITNGIFKDLNKKNYDKAFKKQFEKQLIHSILDHDNIHRALEKTLASQKFEKLPPKLKDFILNYEEAVNLSKNYASIKSKIKKSDENEVEKTLKIQQLDKSLGVDIKTTWEAMSFQEQKSIREAYGITQQNINELGKPIQRDREDTLMKMHKKISGWLDELENAKGKRSQVGKGKIAEELQTFVTAAVSNTGALYRKTHLDDFKHLINRAKGFGIQIDMGGD